MVTSLITIQTLLDYRNEYADEKPQVAHGNRPSVTISGRRPPEQLSARFA